MLVIYNVALLLCLAVMAVALLLPILEGMLASSSRVVETTDQFTAEEAGEPADDEHPDQQALCAPTNIAK
jgi:hypothetical protein